MQRAIAAKLEMWVRNLNKSEDGAVLSAHLPSSPWFKRLLASVQNIPQTDDMTWFEAASVHWTTELTRAMQEGVPLSLLLALCRLIGELATAHTASLPAQRPRSLVLSVAADMLYRVVLEYSISQPSVLRALLPCILSAPSTSLCFHC